MKEQLDTAFESSNKAMLGTYEWKMSKKINGDGNYVQETIKLMDATNSQLKDFYMHCLTMLNNTDSKFPGRKVLLRTVEEQIQKCNAEIFFRVYAKDADRVSTLVDPIKSVLKDNNLQDSVNTLFLKDVVECSEEFANLPLSVVLDAGLQKLGLFDRTYMTLTFLLNKGLKLSETERDRYQDYDESEIIESVYEELRLRSNNIPFTFRNNTGLSISQLQYLLPLKKKRYVEIPTEILELLRDKLLIYLQSDIKFHIGQWEDRMNQIEAVAAEKGLSL